MPKPSLRTRSRKRRSLRLPGGRTNIRYEREKIGNPHCTRCGRTLSGVPHLTPSQLHKLPASQRRQERMYGGQLCYGCLRDLLKNAAREI